MEDFGVKTLSETIDTLTELRYLGLRNNYIQQIPHSIVGLKKLEVLDIALNFMVEVPDITWEMGALRDLHMSDVICRKPLKVDALQYLRTLTYISIYDWTYEVSGLKKMTKLQKLGIEEVDEDSDVGKLFASLAMFSSYFRHLILRGFRFRSMPSLDKIGVLTKLNIIKLDGHLAKLPSPENFLRQVQYLTLVNTCLDEDPMPLLQKLTGLKRLKLQNAYTGREMVIQCSWGTYITGFYGLKALHISELWNLRKIHVEKGVMSDLKQLEIKHCPHLDTLPEEIGSMVKLIKFKMVTTKHIATKVRDSGLTSNILDVDIIP